MLLPAAEFYSRAGLDGEALAEHFNVPVEQVTARRVELDRA